jgi:hypothetical protein
MANIILGQISATAAIVHSIHGIQQPLTKVPAPFPIALQQIKCYSLRGLLPDPRHDLKRLNQLFNQAGWVIARHSGAGK